MSKEEDYPLELWDAGMLALFSATELDRLKREKQITNRKTLPYFSTILINTASILTEQEPQEPPFRTLQGTHYLGRDGLIIMMQRAFGKPIAGKITEVSKARASDLRTLASDLRNYRKISPDQIERDIHYLLEISKEIRFKESRWRDVRYVA